MKPDSKILLLGKNGQLGGELQQTLAPLGHLTAIDYDEVDLAEADRLRQLIRELSPHLIVNAAAYTDVDRAEQEEERCFAINATAPRILAEEAKRCGAALFHYSTDYVFDGQKGTPYLETDRPNPLSAYGRSKLEGEQAIQAIDDSYLIVRTAWLYSRRGNNFVTKVLQWSRERPLLRVVSDQVSNPTWARHLAEATGLILSQSSPEFRAQLRERRGLFHLAGAGYTSRFDWAGAILELDPRRVEQVTREIKPAATWEFPTPARRPLFSALDCTRILEVFGQQMAPWRTGLELALRS